MKWVVASAWLALAAGCLNAQVPASRMEGRWELDLKKSNLAGMQAKPEMLVEVIHVQGPRVSIASTAKAVGQPPASSTLVLSTDGHPNKNLIQGTEFSSNSHWDGDKLVTQVNVKGSMVGMTEVRRWSPDGKTQTVELYPGVISARPQQTRVMVRKGDK